MDLISEPSRGANLIAQSMALPPSLPAPTVQTAAVEVYWQEKDATTGALLGTPNPLGRFSPGAAGSFSYNPREGKTVALFAVSYNAWNVPHVQELKDAITDEVDVARAMGTAAGFDEHVPTVTEAPTIAKSDYLDQWIVFTPAPDDNGATLIGVDIYVEKTSDALVFDHWQMLPVGSSHRIDQKEYPCRIKYRWRNQTQEDAGNGRGVSAWSPQSNAAEVGAGSPDPGPSAVLPSFDPDPNDSRAGFERDVLT